MIYWITWMKGWVIMTKIVNPEQHQASTEAKGKLCYDEKKRILFLGLPWTFTKYELRENVLTTIKGFFTVTEDDCYMYKISLLLIFVDIIHMTGVIYLRRTRSQQMLRIEQLSWRTLSMVEKSRISSFRLLNQLAFVVGLLACRILALVQEISTI